MNINELLMISFFNILVTEVNVCDAILLTICPPLKGLRSIAIDLLINGVMGLTTHYAY